MTKKYIIGSRVIENKSEVYSIAEIGINHEGNIDICAKMIKAASEAGADAVKLQTIDPDENYAKHTDSYKLFKKAWLDQEETEKMFLYARSLNIEPFTTVGDFKTLEWVKKLRPEVYKISSGLINHIPLIKKISQLNKPVIISKGTATEKEVDIAVNSFLETGNQSLILLHCVSSYPTPYNQANLSLVSEMIKKYSFPIGYSDHVLGYKAVLAAVILGACVIEKHFSLDTTRKDFDHKISLDQVSFKNMVEEIKIYKDILGNGSNWLSIAEEKNKKWMRRIIVAKHNLNEGQKIEESDILFMRLSSGVKGLSPIEYSNILNKVLRKKVNINMPINFEDFYD